MGERDMLTVLLVEDDPAQSRLVADVLREAGYLAVAIADHDHIGAAVSRLRPGCVLIDGEVGVSGEPRTWDDASEMRRTHPGLPVVLMTGDPGLLAEAREGSSERSCAAGFVAVVGKPFAPDDLVATVRRAMDGTSGPIAPGPRASTTVATADDGSRLAERARTAAFFDSVVHELRSPLTTIKGQIQRARRSDRTDQDARETALDRALGQVTRMDKLITELLDRSSVREGARALEIVTFDLGALVADTVAQHDSDGAISFAAGAPVYVRGDPFRVVQIIDNLISNAVKYGDPGSAVTVTIERVGHDAVVRVEDRGIGIAAEERERIFEPFYRSTRTSEIAGTGLGLHISRILAEQHGGHLWLDRSSHLGSVFAFALPLAIREEALS